MVPDPSAPVLASLEITLAPFVAFCLLAHLQCIIEPLNRSHTLNGMATMAAAVSAPLRLLRRIYNQYASSAASAEPCITPQHAPAGNGFLEYAQRLWLRGGY